MKRCPTYEHDCDTCLFLRTEGVDIDTGTRPYDWYFCITGGSLGQGAVIGRFGDDPAGYWSCPLVLVRREMERNTTSRTMLAAIKVLKAHGLIESEPSKPFKGCDRPNTNWIRQFMHCLNCLESKPSDVSPKDWARTQTGVTKWGFQVWCNRCDSNLMHIDFEGHQHPADTTRYVADENPEATHLKNLGDDGAGCETCGSGS